MSLQEFQDHLKEVNAGYDKIWLLHRDVMQFPMAETDTKGFAALHHLADKCHMAYSDMSQLLESMVRLPGTLLSPLI